MLAGSPTAPPVKLLLHSIALEPARWTPARVSHPLIELLPAIAAANFRELEIYEPHLGAGTVSPLLRDHFSRLEIIPVILSSYLDLNPARTSDSLLEETALTLIQRVDCYGFRKVRLFPGSGMDPQDGAAIAIFMDRLGNLARRLAPVEVLLETHDNTLADSPALLVSLLDRLPANVGLLYQPTFFTRERALEQFRLQKPFIRHLHLQNRTPSLSFATIGAGVIPWQEILPALGEEVGATIEFVPVGICPAETFNLQATLRQAREEMDYVHAIRAGMAALPG